MSPPWMPLYVADYRQDTAHLSAAEHGAYLLLIMHYWSAGCLPTEDRQLARIAAMSPAEWKRSRSTIEPFFLNGWKHKRIDAELARAADISNKRRASAEQRHGKRDANADANAEQLDTHAGAGLPSPSQTQELGEASEKPIIKNLADPVGGRKPTRPAINGFFDEFWKAYPKRGDAANPRKPASEKFERAIRGGADPAVIIAAAARYASIESTAGRSNTDKIAQAVTWLNQQRWNDYPHSEPAQTPVPPDPSMPSDAELRARYAGRVSEDLKSEDEGVFREGVDGDPTDEKAVRH